MSFPPLRVIVLAGGSGTRLHPLTKTRPKPLLPVGGRPMLDYLLDKLRYPWVDEVVLTVSYGRSLFEPFALKMFNEDEPLGTGGAVAATGAWYGHTLVANADTLLDLNLEDFYRFHLERDVLVSLTAVHKHERSSYGSLTLDSSDRILSFAEKCQTGPGWVNGGLYLLSPGTWTRFPQRRKFSLETDFFPTLSAGHFAAWRCPGDLQDLGTHSAYLQANLDLPGVEENVVLHPEAQLLESYRLSANCRVGKSVIKNSFLDRGVIVGDHCVLDGSIVGPGVHLRDGSKLVGKVLVQGEPAVDVGKARE